MGTENQMIDRLVIVHGEGINFVVTGETFDRATEIYRGMKHLEALDSDKTGSRYTVTGIRLISKVLDLNLRQAKVLWQEIKDAL
jgi:hypothetical protein